MSSADIICRCSECESLCEALHSQTLLPDICTVRPPGTVPLIFETEPLSRTGKVDTEVSDTEYVNRVYRVLRDNLWDDGAEYLHVHVKISVEDGKIATPIWFMADAPVEGATVTELDAKVTTVLRDLAEISDCAWVRRPATSPDLSFVRLRWLADHLLEAGDRERWAFALILGGDDDEAEEEHEG
ncbi:hypothetical protein BDW59DRAFT_163825 [Aspergillus cavernicola]|uniref:Uncharacterized protein n=1 Tax=Aspergillus cavernicola TaxID=176166 RepID=A0ABR4I3A2_9EURO